MELEQQTHQHIALSPVHVLPLFDHYCRVTNMGFLFYQQICCLKQLPQHSSLESQFFSANFTKLQWDCSVPLQIFCMILNCHCFIHLDIFLKVWITPTKDDNFALSHNKDGLCDIYRVVPGKCWVVFSGGSEAGSSLLLRKDQIGCCDIKTGTIKRKSIGNAALLMILGGPWVEAHSSSILSVTYLFSKFFELWSPFLRNDLKRKLLSFSWQQILLASESLVWE